MQDTRYHQIAGLNLLLRDDAYASPCRVAHQFRILVPQHVRVRPRRLGSYARQVDVAAALDVQFAIGQDLRLGSCQESCK